MRNLLELPEISSLAKSAPVRELSEAVLGERAFAVRGILFDKIPEANWKVPWHQDVTIAVRAKEDVEGFGPWSTKAGILHVQPPAQVLERMISIRLHLDACDESNGALHVIPRSHRAGRIAEVEIPSILARSNARACVVGRGGALLMRPLLLHASLTSTCSSARDSFGLRLRRVAIPYEMVVGARHRQLAWDFLGQRSATENLCRGSRVIRRLATTARDRTIHLICSCASARCREARVHPAGPRANNEPRPFSTRSHRRPPDTVADAGAFCHPRTDLRTC